MRLTPVKPGHIEIRIFELITKNNSIRILLCLIVFGNAHITLLHTCEVKYDGIKCVVFMTTRCAANFSKFIILKMVFYKYESQKKFPE